MSMTRICDWVGVSRQAYYQQQKRTQTQAQINQAIVDQVKKIRHRHPRMGTRKLLHKLRPWLAENDYKLGRDRLFELLRHNDLLVVPKRRRPRTTWAGHWRCPNRLAQATLTGPHQAWVSDITYLQTEQGFCYLTLITDAFSRFIVGYSLSDNLTTDGPLAALHQAFKQRPAHAQHPALIHHSDHGSQFTDQRFRQQLDQHNALPSMGAVGDCYDNALAERMNGILKDEYGLDACFVDTAQLQQAVRQAVHLYNHDRPHLALNYHTPSDVHYLN